MKKATGIQFDNKFSTKSKCTNYDKPVKRASLEGTYADIQLKPALSRGTLSWCFSQH